MTRIGWLEIHILLEYFILLFSEILNTKLFLNLTKDNSFYFCFIFLKYNYFAEEE